MDDSRIICDEVIESYDEDTETKCYGDTRSIPTNFNDIFIFLFIFLSHFY